MCWPTSSPASVFKAARVDGFERARRRARRRDRSRGILARHPLAGKGYDFACRSSPADYVTDDAGTGFVHTAPGHGADDYTTFVKHRETVRGWPARRDVPHTVGPDGAYYSDVPLFAGARVIDDEGKDGDANEKVIAALAERRHARARAAGCATSIRIPGAPRRR